MRKGIAPADGWWGGVLGHSLMNDSPRVYFGYEPFFSPTRKPAATTPPTSLCRGPLSTKLQVTTQVMDKLFRHNSKFNNIINPPPTDLFTMTRRDLNSVKHCREQHLILLDLIQYSFHSLQRLLRWRVEEQSVMMPLRREDPHDGSQKPMNELMDGAFIKHKDSELSRPYRCVCMCAPLPNSRVPSGGSDANEYHHHRHQNVSSVRAFHELEMAKDTHREERGKEDGLRRN
ncbi:hypothetical protein CBL_10733 [Carabus blaptoides fortunei]